MWYWPLSVLSVSVKSTCIPNIPVIMAGIAKRDAQAEIVESPRSPQQRSAKQCGPTTKLTCRGRQRAVEPLNADVRPRSGAVLGSAASYLGCQRIRTRRARSSSPDKFNSVTTHSPAACRYTRNNLLTSATDHPPSS
jgi:hypothetical protein